MKTTLLTLFALIAFAGNSILCRYALKGGQIDASSFTAIRLLSGAVFLIILLLITTKGHIDWKAGRWSSSLMLFIYTATFSFAYINLDTGVGALILFGVVQVTMVVVSILKGHRLALSEWFGLLVAFLGLTLLLLPSATAPSTLGFILMAISGAAWGLYTLEGKGTNNPTLLTTGNFVRTIPFIVVLLLIFLDATQLTSEGIVLAIISGAITSGLGYVVWYAALNSLTILQASVLQLTVPIIATVGGVLFLNEVITVQLLISSLLVLGGVLIVTLATKKTKATQKNT